MARTPWPMRDGRMWSSAACDALPAGQFAGMHGDAEPGLAGDLEGPHIVLDVAEALLAGHAEAGDQRVAASAPRSAPPASTDSTPKWRTPVTIMRPSMPVLALARSHAFAERVGIGGGRQAGLAAWSGEMKISE